MGDFYKEIFHLMKIFIFPQNIRPVDNKSFVPGKIINEWDSIGKKKLPQVKVKSC